MTVQELINKLMCRCDKDAEVIVATDYGDFEVDDCQQDLESNSFAILWSHKKNWNHDFKDDRK